MSSNFLSAAPPVSRVQATPAQSTLPKSTRYFPHLVLPWPIELHDH
jgi:hypothetical protein